MKISSDNLIRSPMNYMGGKYKILKFILPFFPNKINTFVDLFAGGLNVGINVNAQKIIANDQLTYLVEIYRYFQKQNWEELKVDIESRIEELNLTDSNQEGYLELRNRYNSKRDSLDLFLLTCYSFNHQIRFNSKHNFNTPFGKDRSSYNSSIAHNLQCFVELIHKKNFCFFDKDFLALNLDKLNSDDYVYCDPPYLISNGSYNDGKRGFKDWGIKEEKSLLCLLDRLQKNGIPFGLSNVIEHKGVKNQILIEWAQKYNMYFINKNYSNCSYHFKDRSTKTVEVFITNQENQEEICQQPQLF